MSDTDTDGTEEARSEFVYDIYYLSKGPTSDRRSMCIDFTTEQFRSVFDGKDRPDSSN